MIIYGPNSENYLQYYFLPEVFSSQMFLKYVTIVFPLPCWEYSKSTWSHSCKLCLTFPIHLISPLLLPEILSQWAKQPMQVIFLFYFKICFICMLFGLLMCLYIPCMFGALQRPEINVGLGTGVKGDCKPLCRCLKLNSSPLEEHSESLNARPSFHSY